MGKFDYRSLKPKEHAELLEELWGSILLLKSKKDVHNFLRGLLTPSEQVMLARRLRIAKALVGGASYQQIRERVGVGISTIEIVDRWLSLDFGDYRRVLSDITQHALRRGTHRVPAEPGTFKHLRHRYPAHFFLLNLILDNPEDW